MEQFEHLEETQLSSEAKYDGTLLHIRRDTVRLPDGKTATREYNIHNGAVCIIPLLENGEVLLERQYRYPLREETGATAAEWHALGLFCPVGAYSTERIQMYLARGLTFGERELDEDEFLNVFRMPLDELVNKVLAGEIPDAKTQAAALRAKLMLERGLI